MPAASDSAIAMSANSSGTPRRLKGSAHTRSASASGTAAYSNEAFGRPKWKAVRANADIVTESKKYAAVPVRPGSETCDSASAPAPAKPT